MEKVFLSILNMSLTAGIIVIAVLIIRLFLKKLPKKYSYFMWSVVGFRLICPVSVGSVFSIFNLKFFISETLFLPSVYVPAVPSVSFP